MSDGFVRRKVVLKILQESQKEQSKGTDLTNYEHMLIMNTDGGIPNGKANEL